MDQTTKRAVLIREPRTRKVRMKALNTLKKPEAMLKAWPGDLKAAAFSPGGEYE